MVTNARLINFIRWSIFFFRDMSPGKRQGWNYRNSIEQKDGCCHFTFFSLYSTPHTYISNKKHQHHCYCYCLAFVFRQPFFTKCLFLIIAWEGLTSSQSLHPKSQLSLSLSLSHTLRGSQTQTFEAWIRLSSWSQTQSIHCLSLSQCFFWNHRRSPPMLFYLSLSCIVWIYLPIYLHYSSYNTRRLICLASHLLVLNTLTHKHDLCKQLHIGQMWCAHTNTHIVLHTQNFAPFWPFVSSLSHTKTLRERKREREREGVRRNP